MGAVGDIFFAAYLLGCLPNITCPVSQDHKYDQNTKLERKRLWYVVWQSKHTPKPSSNLGGLKTNRNMEIVTAKTEISEGLHTVHFDATIKFNESHLAYRPPTQPAYVGPPSAEIDNNWKNLLGGKIN